MIEAYSLKKLLEEYQISATKVIKNNDNILTYGSYSDIRSTLEYLRNELHILPKNIEKCPSIIFFNVSVLKYNYEFLKNREIKTSSIETCLHILSTDPKSLVATYDYVRENYGITSINKITSILSVSVDRIKAIEKLNLCKKNTLSAAISRCTIKEISEIIKVCKKNNIKISRSIFNRTAKEVEKTIEVCKKNNIEITGSIFYKASSEIEQIIEVCKKNNIKISRSIFLKKASEIEQIIEVCRKNNIEITGSIFHKTASEIEQIIEVCKDNNIEITGSIFLKSASEIEQIIEICRKNNIEIIGSIFYKTAKEIEEIIKVCKKNNIEITGSIFTKSPKKLQESIDFIKSNYGESYLTSLIVIRDVNYLKQVFPYLESLQVLPYVINSSSILSLKLDEIKDRKEFIESTGQNIIDKRGRFNSVFGLSRKNYLQKLNPQAKSTKKSK